MYVELEDPPQKPKYVLSEDAKVVLRDYYDAVDTLNQAQTNFCAKYQSVRTENRGQIKF